MKGTFSHENEAGSGMSSRQRRLLLLSSSSLFWLSCMLTVAPSQPQENQQQAPQAAPPAAPAPAPSSPPAGAPAAPSGEAPPSPQAPGQTPAPGTTPLAPITVTPPPAQPVPPRAPIQQPAGAAPPAQPTPPPDPGAESAWLAALESSLATQVAHHAGPIAYVEGASILNVPPPPSPVTVVSATDGAAAARVRDAVAKGHGSLVWEDVEDALIPPGWGAPGSPLIRHGAVSLAGDERPASALLRRTAALLRYWSALLPTMGARRRASSYHTA